MTTIVKHQEPLAWTLVSDTNLVLRLVEDFMWGAQSPQNILAGIPKEDVPLQRPDLGVGHDAGAAGCKTESAQVLLEL